MYKPRVVLDTNIYISATFWTGKPYVIVQKAIEQDLAVFVSDDIIQELRKVLARDFSISKSEIEEMVKSILLFTHMLNPKKKLSAIKDDPDDDRILECALAGNADCIVTQDNHLLKLKEFQNITILTPQEFVEKYL